MCASYNNKEKEILNSHERFYFQESKKARILKTEENWSKKFWHGCLFVLDDDDFTKKNIYETRILVVPNEIVRKKKILISCVELPETLESNSMAKLKFFFSLYSSLFLKIPKMLYLYSIPNVLICRFPSKIF